MIWKLLPLTWKLGIIAAGFVAMVSAYEAWKFKIAHDAKAAVLEQVEREKANAIATAQTARDRIRDLCARDPTGCVRDEWLRND